MAKYVSKENLETLLSALSNKFDTKITDPGDGTKGQVLIKTESGMQWATPEEVEPCDCEEMTVIEMDVIMKGAVVEEPEEPESPEEPEEPEEPKYSTEYVDLGLPSGNLWATCNLGATKPEEYGLYFQWGDVKGYEDACSEIYSEGNPSKHYFDWSKYKFGKQNNLTKYCMKSSYGKQDSLSELEPGDDAATIMLGYRWKMPRNIDFQELIDNTVPGDGADSKGWIVNYNGTGVNGLLLKSKTNGNTIFFPASGDCNGNSPRSIGQTGSYWSSSLNMSDSNISYFLNFYSRNLVVNGAYRSYGFPVRGIKNPNSFSIPYVDLGLPSGLLWTTCNLGAEKETDSGLYFQWGDTKGYIGPCSEAESDGNDNAHYFDWSKYKFGGDDLNESSKYNSTDKLTTLKSEDDAATVMWGDGYRMPTEAEFQELLDNTIPGDGTNTLGWTANYNGTGVNGLLRKSKTNGNTIFFPTCGYCWGEELNDSYVLGTGANGGYWSKSRSGNEPSIGYGLHMTSEFKHNVYLLTVGLVPRFEGDLIRAVKDDNAKLEPEDETTYEVLDGVKCVDLGLPSGSRWAVCNLGAEKETDGGLYFQWGDTQGYAEACPPQYSDGNPYGHYFDWSKYKYCKGTANSLTKYCSTFGYGTMDYKKVLDKQDDAVNAAFGNLWVTPTTEHFTELINNTVPGDGANEWGWIENYKGTGVNGILRKSKISNNTIFFPAVGQYVSSDSKPKYAGTDCYYWTQYVDGDPGLGIIMRYVPGNLGPNSLTRCYGAPIRGIYPKQGR